MTNANVITDTIENWPGAEELSDFYLGQVEGASTCSHPCSISASSSKGPLYVDGDLEIKGNIVVTLTGTVYIEGDLKVNPTPNITLNLNGHTIYVKGAIDNFQPGCTIFGSGCIIAEGNIDFQPNIGSSDEDFVFVMSVLGTSTIQPTGDFYGSVAGDVQVDLHNARLTWTDWHGKDLNFPDGSTGNMETTTYNINP